MRFLTCYRPREDTDGGTPDTSSKGVSGPHQYPRVTKKTKAGESSMSHLLDVRLPCPILNGESGIGYSAAPSPPPVLPSLPPPSPSPLPLPLPSPSPSPSGSSGTDCMALVGRDDSIPERGRGLKPLPELLPALCGGGGVYGVYGVYGVIALLSYSYPYPSLWLNCCDMCRMFRS